MSYCETVLLLKYVTLSAFPSAVAATPICRVLGVATVAGDFADSVPVAGLMSYCETASSPESVTYALLPSGETATAQGPAPAATLTGLRGDSPPSPRIANCATW